MFENTSALMDKRIAGGVPGNDVIVYHKGREVYRSYRGYSDIESKTPMTGDELYNIFSCTKPITCVAALMLYERACLPLDARLSDYFPEFENMLVKCDTGATAAAHPILIKHLFSMTAGFSYNLNYKSILEVKERTAGRAPTLDTMRALSAEVLELEPGTAWIYSLCHDILGALIEHISGMPFGSFVKESIFDVCGMTSSTFLPDEEMRGRLAAQYLFDKETNTLTKTASDDNPYRLGTEYESGGAGMVSTVGDYIKFLEALRCGRLISRDTVAMMCESIFPEADNRNYWHSADGYGYGLGVRCHNSEGDGICDFGWDGAAGSYLAVDMKNEISVFYAQHVRGSHVAYAQNELIKEIYKDLGI